MESPINEKINNTMEQLLNKIEKLQIKEKAENENTEKVLLIMQRLTDELGRMEIKRKEEEELLGRLDIMANNMEKVFGPKGVEIQSNDGLDKAIKKIVNSIKIFGQILAILATSVQLAVDSVGSVLSDKNSEAAIPNAAQAKTQADLALLLHPLTTLVQSLVDEKIKKSAASKDNSNLQPEVVQAEKDVD